MKTFHITLGECEHSGDLEEFISSISKFADTSKTRFVRQPFDIDEDDEEGIVSVSFKGDKDALLAKLDSSDVRGFYHTVREIKS